MIKRKPRKAKRRPNNSGTIFQYPSGKYGLLYSDSTGKRIKRLLFSDEEKSIPAMTKAEAENAAARLVPELQKINQIKDQIEYITAVAKAKKIIRIADRDLDECWSFFLTTPTRRELSEKYLKTYKSFWGRFVTWVQTQYKIKKLQKLKREMVEAFFVHLWKTNVSERTYNVYRRLLAYVYTVVTECPESENIFSGIAPRIEYPQKRYAFSLEHILRIFAFLQPDHPHYMLNKCEMRVMLHLMYYTGCRGEDAALMRLDSLVMDQMLSNGGRGAICYAPLKGKRKKKTVTVPMHPTLRGVLFDYLKTVEGNPLYLLPSVAERYKRNPDGVSQDIIKLIQAATGLAPNEEPREGVRRVEYTKKIMKNGKEVQVKQKRKISRYSMHSFKHTFVTDSAEFGGDTEAIQEFAGHESVEMTRYYRTLSDRRKVDAIAVLPDVNGKHASKDERGELLEYISAMSPKELAKVKAMLQLVATDGKTH